MSKLNSPWQEGKDRLKSEIWVALMTKCHSHDIFSDGPRVGIQRGYLAEAIMASVWMNISSELRNNREPSNGNI